MNPTTDSDCCSVPDLAEGAPTVASADPLSAPGKPITILFACRQNAGRSQIAAALAGVLAGPNVRVLSAGTTPATEIHPNVALVLSEAGLEPLSKPTKLDPADVEQADWVITMGCGETCPIFPGVHYEDWDVEDPSDKGIIEVRKIRDAIQTRVEDLLARI